MPLERTARNGNTVDFSVRKMNYGLREVTKLMPKSILVYIKDTRRIRHG